MKEAMEAEDEAAVRDWTAGRQRARSNRVCRMMSVAWLPHTHTHTHTHTRWRRKTWHMQQAYKSSRVLPGKSRAARHDCQQPHFISLLTT